MVTDPGPPHHTEPRPELTCAFCWRLHGVRGSVSAVATEDGTVLYYRCCCGSDEVDWAPVKQLDLFGRTASA